ncbi:MAG: hypothetical protein Q8K60_04990 [Parachlamydiaceae bacterium]|nr:hypothetical protein [Parachlamydiaceae bacterium]
MPSHSSKNNQNDSEEYKIPDEIIIDDRSDDSNTVTGSSFEEKQSDFENQSSGETKAISLRLLCFLGLLFSIVFGLAMLFIAAVASILALVTFLSNDEINQNAMKFWKLYMHAAISGVCCLVGVFFPPVGLSLLLLYLSTSDGSESNSTVSNMMKKIFGNFFR